MVSTAEEFTDFSPSLSITPTTVKKPSARKSLCLSTDIFDVKKKTVKRRVEYSKYKRKSIKVLNILWTYKLKKGH